MGWLCPQGQLLEQSRTLLCLRDLDPHPSGRRWIPLPCPKDDFFYPFRPCSSIPSNAGGAGPCPTCSGGSGETVPRGAAPKLCPQQGRALCARVWVGAATFTWGEETQNSNRFGLEKGRRGIIGDGFTPEPGFTSLTASVCLCRFPPPGHPFRLPHSCR